MIIGVSPNSLFKVTKMVSDGRNHASTATKNLLYFTLYGQIIRTNDQTFKITKPIVLIWPRLTDVGSKVCMK